MERKQLLETLGRMANAYSELAQSKADCDDVITSEMNLIVAASNDPVTNSQKKSIKKIAKAMADEKVDGLTEEAQEMAELLLVVAPE